MNAGLLCSTTEDVATPSYQWALYTHTLC